MYICTRIIYFASVDDFSYGYWNGSDRVFCFFDFISY